MIYYYELDRYISFYKKHNNDFSIFNLQNKYIYIRDLCMCMTIIDFDRYKYEIYSGIKDLLEIINSSNIPLNLGYGITSLGYLLQMIKSKNNKLNEYILYIDMYLEKVANYCISSDEFIISNGAINKNYDYIHGYTGLLNYILLYSSNKKLKNEIVFWIINFINLNNLVVNINLGIAHGISSLLLLLSNVDNKEVIIENIETIKRFEELIYSEYKKGLYVCKNYLSWGNGYLGILFSLIKCANVLNERKMLNVYYDELIKLLKTYEPNKDLNICFGIGGTIRMLKQIKEIYQSQINCNLNNYIDRLISLINSNAKKSTANRKIDTFVRESSIFDGNMSDIIVINSLDTISEVINIYYSMFLM